MPSQQPTLKDLLNTRRDSREQRRKSSETGSTVLHFGRAVLLILLLVAPWCIGSVHLASQTFLLCGMCLVLAAWWLDFVFYGTGRSRYRLVPYVLVPVLLGWVLAFVQVTPLPQGIASWLAPGQQRIYQESSFDEPLGPEESAEAKTTVSLDVDATWRQAGMLVLAASCLFVAGHFFRSRNGVLHLLWVMAANGAAISVVGIYEKSTEPTGKLLGFYEPLYQGAYFGPFVNRNNAAGFLLICLGCCLGLVYLLLQQRKSRRPVPIISQEIPVWRQLKQTLEDFVAQLTVLKAISILLTVVICCGVLATLSRGGTLGALGAGLTTVILFGLARKPKGALTLFGLVAVLSVGLAGYLGFGEQLSRRFENFDNQEITEVQRYQNWRDTWPAVSEFGPAGSGLGAYHTVHRMYRSDEELNIYQFAENQYYQALIDGGWVALVLLLAALGITLWCIVKLAGTGQSDVSVGCGLVGLFVVCAVSLASLFDFGLYIPANMMAMAVVVGVVCGNAHWQAQRSESRGLLGYQGVVGLSPLLALGLFAGLIYNTAYCYRLAVMESRSVGRVESLSYQNADLAKVDGLIADLEPLVLQTPTAAGLRSIGMLYQLRYQLMAVDDLLGGRGNRVDENGRLLAWKLVGLDQLHRELAMARQAGDEAGVARLMRNPAVAENLPRAIEFYRRSRRRMPAQAEVHARLAMLAKLHAADPEPAEIASLRRVAEFAPANARLHYLAGKIHLQSGRKTEAAKCWKRTMALSPVTYFNPVVERALLVGIPLEMPKLDRQTLAEEVLPEAPAILFKFARGFLAQEDERDLKREVLVKANELIGSRSLADFDALKLSGEIKFALGLFDEAFDEMDRAVELQPNNENYRWNYAKRLFQQQRPEAAHDQAIELVRLWPETKRYLDFFEKTKSKAN